MKILIIEKDKALSDAIKQSINKKYKVDQEYDGYSGYMVAKEKIYDMVLLDIVLPEMSGYEVLKKLREEKIYVPVLILSSKDTIEDKVKFLNSGADDYMVKPFAREELVARINAIIRRAQGKYLENVIEFKDLRLNQNSRKAFFKSEEILLPGKQFEILEYLIYSKNTIVTKEQIFERIWGFDSNTTTNVVEVYTSELRKNLKKFGYDKYLKTIRRVGYILSEWETITPSNGPF